MASFNQLRKLTAALLLVLASGYRRYLNFAPNSAAVPCADKAEGCHGASICEAWGHVACLAKGDGEGNVATPAGASLQAAIETGGWNVDACAADSDGDGKTDGDELGDGCCAWSYGQTTMDTKDISNPSFTSSVTKRPSCTLDGVPPQPTGLAVTTTADAIGSGGVQISWTANNATATCVCEYKLVVQIGNGQPSTYGLHGGPVTLCGMSAGATVSATLYALNRAGTSRAAGPTVGTVSNSGPACSASSFKTYSPFYIDLAGTQAKVPGPPPAYAGVLPFVILGALLAVTGCLVSHMPDPASGLREKLVHKYIGLKREAPPAPRGGDKGGQATPGGQTGAAGQAGGNGGPAAAAPPETLGKRMLSMLLPPFADLGEASIGYTLALLATMVAIAACAGATAAYYEWMIFPLGTKASFGRGVGYALAASMGLQLLPAARYSLWLPIFGVSFERALKFHRWAGVGTVFLALLHALLMFLEYAHTPLGINYVVLWLPNDAVNPLAGFLSGLFIVILTILAWDPIRRKAYELFLVGHMLWPLAFLFGWLHIKESDTGINPVFLPPLALCVLDFALLAVDMGWLRDTVLLDAGVVYADGRVVSLGSLDKASSVGVAGSAAPGLAASASPSGVTVPGGEPIVSFLVMDKLPASFGWAFSYHPGQFVYISLPRISPWPHPISISSPCDPEHPGRFTVHIRSMGAGTWSGSLAAAVQSALEVKASSAGRADGEGVGGSINALRTLGNAVGVPVQSNGNTAVQLAVPDWGSLPASVSTLTTSDINRLPVPREIQSKLWVTAAGPFGAPSVQLPRYRHFFLVAGGIGVTPIASLHYSLLHGLAVGHRGGAAGVAWEALRAMLCRGNSSRNKGMKGVNPHEVADMLSVTTLWSVREAGLIQAFVPLLQDQAPVSTGWRSSFTTPVTPAPGDGSVTPATPGLTTLVPVTGSAVQPAVNLGVYYSGGGGAGNRGEAKPGTQGDGRAAARPAPAAAPAFPWPTRSGRADYRALMRQAADTAANQEAAAGAHTSAPHISVAVVVCGPQPMVESVLAAAADVSGYCPTVPGMVGKPVHFHVHRETFIM